jgi:hypothetical protein
MTEKRRFSAFKFTSFPSADVHQINTFGGTSLSVLDGRFVNVACKYSSPVYWQQNPVKPLRHVRVNIYVERHKGAHRRRSPTPLISSFRFQLSSLLTDACAWYL